MNLKDFIKFIYFQSSNYIKYAIDNMDLKDIKNVKIDEK